MADNYTLRDTFQLEALLSELRRDEGEVLCAYSDSKDDKETLKHLKGYLTIGIGILIDQRRGGGITHEESEYLCINRIKSKAAELDSKLPWWRGLSPVRQRVLLNMAFNMGTDGLLAFHDTLDYIKHGQYDSAVQAMKDSRWAGQVGARADRLIEMMRKG